MMIYTKEEFEEIVKQFNIDKNKYNWVSLVDKNVRNWERFKKKIVNYPSYYDFNSGREFKYWLSNSEKEDFIEERFCPICNKFLEVQPCGFQGKYRVACDEHLKEVRMKNVEKGMIAKYGFKTPGKSKEVWKKVRETNLKKYGVEYPLQNKEIHKRTIENALKNDSYVNGCQKGKETKKKRYGDENYNNAKQISETKLNQPKEVKQEIIKKTKSTLKERYGNENYNNIEQIKKTCLDRYGEENVFAVKQFKKKIKENELKSRIRNHTTQQELMKSTERKYPNHMTYKENYLSKTNRTKEANGTTSKQLFTSNKIYKDGLTYKEYWIKKTKETKENNKTTQKDLYSSTKILENGLTYKETHVLKMNQTKTNNHTTPQELMESNEIYKDGLTFKEWFVKQCYETKKTNHTFRVSKPEKLLYKVLLNRFIDVEYQYRSKLYPFTCDFYIPKYDLYIEFQGYVGHGNHPYDPNNPDDVSKVLEWEQKAKEIGWDGKEKTQYMSYIHLWTQQDPKKREIAKQNNLNFIEIFPNDFDNNIDAILEYIDSYIENDFTKYQKSGKI